MSRFTQQFRAIPKDRRTLRSFYGFFSAIWVVSIGANCLGYWSRISNMGGHMSLAQLAFFLLIIVCPLIVIWLPYWLTSDIRFEGVTVQSGPKSTTLDPEQLHEISVRLEALSKENKEVRLTLTDLLSDVSAVVHSSESASQDARDRVHANFDAPILPLSEQKDDLAEIKMDDVATALDFVDRVQKGDWAVAFTRVQSTGSLLELIRVAEKIIDVFEEEGIFVEDIAIATPPAHAWRTFAKGTRNPETEKLAFLKDLSVQTLIRSRLKTDPYFQDVSLRFQKSFIDMVEVMVPRADKDELIALANSRAGRAFAILGGISKTFATKDLG